MYKKKKRVSSFADKTLALSKYIHYTGIVKEKDAILIIPFKISSLFFPTEDVLLILIK